MSRTKQAESLLSKIYGPYPDHIILRVDFPRPGTKLPIKGVQLHSEGDKAIIGFDDTEYLTTPPAGSHLQTNPRVVFFGVIEIEDLNWLSAKGREYLEADFKEENERLTLEHVRTGLDLEAAYGLRKQNSPLLSVRVCCCKVLSALFLTSKLDPDKLLLHAQNMNKNRVYWVKSLHPRTYDASLNFFERYRLRALIDELILTDPKHTPLEERTIDWIVRRYFETIRPRDCERRYIVENSMEEDIFSEPRHLRHVSHAEIRGYFAAHAEWLLAQQISSNRGSNKLFNPQQWIAFCRQARKDAVAAKQHGIIWGGALGHQSDYSEQSSLAQRLAKFGQTTQFWQTQLKAAQQNKSKRGSRKQSPGEEAPQITTLQPISYQYDPDFSEPSTPEPSDSESDTDLLSPKIPGYLMETPKVLNGQFKWSCRGCSFHIDLLNLPQESMRVLPADILGILRRGSWTICEEGMQRALFLLVSDHYHKQHLGKSSIQVIQSRHGNWQVADHRPNEKGRQKSLDTRIKEEPEESVSSLRRSNRKLRRPQYHSDNWQ